MLQKSGGGKTRSGFFSFVAKSAKILFVVELVAFTGSYLVWHRMNTNRDFRRYMNENYPVVLESYYSFGELMGRESTIRGVDKAYWDNNEPSKKSN